MSAINFVVGAAMLGLSFLTNSTPLAIAGAVWVWISFKEEEK